MDTSIKAVLILEGSDEQDVVNHLCEKHMITGITLEVLDGRDRLTLRAKSIAGDSKYREVHRVGIIYDSEEEPAQTKATLEKVKQLITQQSPKKTVQVLQLPADNEVGSFEALCLQAIAPTDPVLSCCNQYLQCLEGKDHKLTTQARKDKARLLAWYAAKTGKHISRIGRDAVEGDQSFDYGHPAFVPLVSFLRSLVG